MVSHVVLHGAHAGLHMVPHAGPLPLKSKFRSLRRVIAVCKYTRHIYSLQLMYISQYVFCLNPLEPAKAKWTFELHFMDGFLKVQSGPELEHKRDQLWIRNNSVV